jgi:hypothetical protein
MNRANRRLAAPHIRTRRIIENSRISGQGTGLNAHRLVAETAVGIAEAMFPDYMAANNELWKAFRAHMTEKEARVVFVKQAAPQLLEEARLTLTDMLSQPDDVVPVKVKDEIAEALIKDTDFRANRLKAAEHMDRGLLN